jgi:hypothetical protein
MRTDFGEDEKYFATSITHPEYAELLRQAIADDNPLLPIVERLASHASGLQDKIVYCRSRGEFCDCACACDYDDPGDVCKVHGEKAAQAEPSYVDMVNAPLSEEAIAALRDALKSGQYPRFRRSR